MVHSLEHENETTTCPSAASVCACISAYGSESVCAGVCAYECWYVIVCVQERYPVCLRANACMCLRVSLNLFSIGFWTFFPLISYFYYLHLSFPFLSLSKTNVCINPLI